MEAMDMFIEKATIAITKPSTNRLGIKANGGATAFGSLKRKIVYQGRRRKNQQMTQV